MLVAVCGLPGAGKTTVAEVAADRLDADHFRTDVIRKDIYDDPDYTDEEERTVYGELLDRAHQRLGVGADVVIDATFRKASQRERAGEVAAEFDVPFVLIEVVCEDAVVRERIRARTDDPSDADVEVHELYREKFDPVEGDHVVVDNSGSMTEMRRQVAAAIDAAPERADLP